MGLDEKREPSPSSDLIGDLRYVAYWLGGGKTKEELLYILGWLGEESERYVSHLIWVLLRTGHVRSYVDDSKTYYRATARTRLSFAKRDLRRARGRNAPNISYHERRVERLEELLDHPDHQREYHRPL